MNRRNLILFLLFISFIVVVLRGYFLLSRPFADNDEGIYLSTFLLVSKGYRLYQEVFFSQLPSFFMLVYPFFVFLGRTLFAARMVIFGWSLIGLLGMIWLFWETKRIYLAPVAILLLWTIPKFFLQNTTFQSDALTTSLSIICLAACIKFSKTNKIVWFLIAEAYFCLAVLTKLDITIGPILLFFIYKHFGKVGYKKNELISLFLVPFFILLTVFASFSWKAVIENVFSLRLMAAKIYPVAPLNFWQYLKEDNFLFTLTLISFALLIINISARKISGYTLMVFIWLISTSVFIVFFRPIFPHHLSLLAVPLTLAVLLSFSDVFHTEKKIGLVIIVFLILVVLNFTLIKKADPPLSKNDSSAVRYIVENSKPGDHIICDEAKFYFLSQRLPPPFLSDISSVRILSGSINPGNFTKELVKYKPKLIVLWNGRLKQLKGLGDILSQNGYKIVKKSFGADKQIYSN